jgi:hypothetical protein
VLLGRGRSYDTLEAQADERDSIESHWIPHAMVMLFA